MDAVTLDCNFAYTRPQQYLCRYAISPAIVAFSIAAGAFLLFLLLAYSFDVPVYDARDTLRFPVTPHTWTALIYSLLLGYGFVVSPVTLALNSRDLQELVHLSPHFSAQSIHRICVGTFRKNARNAQYWGFVASVLGIVPMVLSMLALQDHSSYSGMAWFAIFVPIIFFQLGFYACASTRILRKLMGEITQSIEIDFLDMDSLRPFSKIAIRNAMSWMIPANLLVLLFVNIPAAELSTIWWPLAANLLIGVTATLIPLFEIHSAIKQAKQRIVSALNDNLRDVWRDEYPTQQIKHDVALAHHLFEIRSYIVHAREWPMDASSLGRLAFYLFIVLGGWVGGAIVERMFETFW